MKKFHHSAWLRSMFISAACILIALLFFYPASTAKSAPLLDPEPFHLTDPSRSQFFTPQFFQTHSTWYEKIPANQPLLSRDPCTSMDFINDVIFNSELLTISYKEWSVPVFYAEESTPIQDVIPYSTSSQVAIEAIESNGWNKNVPNPSEAHPASAADGHLVIISHDRQVAWDFFQAKKDGSGSLSAQTIKRWDLNGDGIDQPYTYAGSRVAPVPLLHGLITYDEIVHQGTINHALAFAYNQAKRDSPGVYPCVTSNNSFCDRECCLWLGFRLQLNPKLDLDTLDLNWSSRIIAKAMQEYGMIFVENNGVGYNAVYAENLEAKAESWDGIFDGSIMNIPLDQFRIVESVFPSDNPIVEDINLDSQVNILDIQLCVNVSLGKEQDPEVRKRADINNDSVVDNEDIQLLIHKLIQSSDN
jgi:hypothetical protein